MKMKNQEPNHNKRYKRGLLVMSNALEAKDVATHSGTAANAVRTPKKHGQQRKQATTERHVTIEKPNADETLKNTQERQSANVEKPLEYHDIQSEKRIQTIIEKI